MEKLLMLVLCAWIGYEFYHLKGEESSYSLEHAIKERLPLDCRIDANDTKRVMVEDYSYQEDFYIVLEDKKLRIRQDACVVHHQTKH